MKPFPVSLATLIVVLLVAVTTFGAQVLSPSEVYVHYKFDDTSGTAFVDSSPNGNNATLYSLPFYEELPAIDAMDTYYPYGAFGNATCIGNTTILGFNKEVMIDVPTAPQLPGVSDTFAVSFWLSSPSWGGSDGLLACYNYKGLEWSLGMQSRSATDGLSLWTNSADETGNGYFGINCVNASLTDGTFNHFVMQFDGSAGITNVYINGTSIVDNGGDANSFWGNEREGIVLGGRVLDARPYTTIGANTFLDDFAVIDGVVDSTDLNNLYTSGASSLGSRRLLHYAMNNSSGSVVTDSSSYANHGTLIANDPATVRAIHDVAPTARVGQIDGAMEFSAGCRQYAVMDENGVNAMPVGGDDFTVCFWFKPDENMAGLYGWDTAGNIASWSNDDLGFSVSQDPKNDGAIIVRRTSGDYTSPDNDVYGIFVGPSGLDLDPNEFHHFAITVNTDGDITGIYVDGDYQASTESNGLGITDEETAIFGSRLKNGNLDSQLCAYLDDYAVVSGELTKAEIELAMSHGVVALYTESPLIPGDANGDNKVDGSDVTILANHWQEGVGAPDPTNITWAMGDFNGDGQVDGSDVTILANHWQEGVASVAASVPEPGTLILVLCGALSLFVLRWKKRG